MLGKDSNRHPSQPMRSLSLSHAADPVHHRLLHYLPRTENIRLTTQAWLWALPRTHLSARCQNYRMKLHLSNNGTFLVE